MMLNISTSSIPTATARSSSTDISDPNGSPRTKIPKNGRRSLSIFSAKEIRPSLPMMSKEDFQARLAFMTAEVDRLTRQNSQLLAEVDNWKIRFREAVEKSAIPSGQKSIKTGGDLPNETFDIFTGPHEVEAWKEKYVYMERSYRNEIESLKSRLHTSLLESAKKKNGIEMTPKVKGDFNGTPRFANNKENTRPLSFESPHHKAEDNAQVIMKARIEEMYMENKALVSQVDYYKRNWEAQRKDIEALRKQIVELPRQKTQEKDTSMNQDDFAEMCEPIYMKALLFEDAVEQYEEKSCSAVVEAVKGDDALSISESFTEEKLFETEKLREELRKLQKDVTRYEGIITLLSKKAQEGLKWRNEKENIEKELVLYKQKVIGNEKQLGHPSPPIQQDHMALITNDTENKIIVLQQIEEQLKLELTRLNTIVQEQELTSKAYANENERILTSTAAEAGKLQGRILELEGNIKRLNAEIDVWKAEYGRLDSRRKQEKQGSDGSKIELQLRFDQSEKRAMELAKENGELNELLRMRTLEIDELKEGTRTSIKSYQEEMNQKWIRSCTQMEEIALCLESRKENMQAQLERMKALLEANAQELEELYEQNEEKNRENLALLEEVKRWRQMS